MIEIGQEYQDNDPRRPGRILKVTAIDGAACRVQVESNGRRVWIASTRFRPIGKRKGYSPVPKAPIGT